MAVRSEKHQAAIDKRGGATAKGRRLAFMKRRYAKPSSCTQCHNVAHWRYMNKGYCNIHLPSKATYVLNKGWDDIMKVGDAFDQLHDDQVVKE